MALQSSGAISLNEIHIEAGGSSGTQASINDTDIRGLIGKSSGAQMSFSEWYGASAETVLTSGGTVNGQAQRQEITASSFISSGGTLRIPSNIWIWSNSESTPALTVDIACTIINEGKIIGKGGHGGGDSGVNDGVTNGGVAISVTSTGVTIQNASGAYIAGGGGGGQYGSNRSSGGGGAGGGHGGNTANGDGGNGGALNATGADGENPYSGVGSGGGAGGGGGGTFRSGGGGGRILPGTGGAGGTNSGGTGGNGGSAGNVGGAGSAAAGGGGGWGARGGFQASNSSSYGTGGAAISKTTSYTLSNSGTIYGAT